MIKKGKIKFIILSLYFFFVFFSGAMVYAQIPYESAINAGIQGRGIINTGNAGVFNYDYAGRNVAVINGQGYGRYGLGGFSGVYGNRGPFDFVGGAGLNRDVAGLGVVNSDLPFSPPMVPTELVPGFYMLVLFGIAYIVVALI